MTSTQEDDHTIVINRKGGEVNGQLPIKLKSNKAEQVKAWADELHSCRQLSREELADEPDPEFEIASEIADKVEQITARRQSSVDTVSMSPEIKSESTQAEPTVSSSRQESVVEDDRIEVETIESLSVPITPTTPTTSLITNPLASRSTSIEEANRKESETGPLKRTHSRDLPEGLPKPIKSSDSSKRGSLSRQTSSLEANKKGDRTPEASLSRKNSTADKLPSTGSGSRLSSRKNSLNSEKGESLSRKSSVKQTDAMPSESNSKTPSTNVSRRGSKTKSPEPSTMVVDSKEADVQMYEESQTVPVKDSLIEQDLGRTGSRRTSRQLSSGTPKIKIARQLQNACVAIEEIAKFECELDSSCASAVVVEWLRDGKVLNLAGRYRASVEGPVHSLQISRVIDEDAGQYTALITSGAEQVRSTALLKVKPENADFRPCTPGGSLLPCAPIFKIRLKDTKLLLGSKVRFELLVYAHPPATVTFSKDGVPLRENDRVKVKRKTGESFELIIDKIQSSDAGSYSVRAVNDHGEDHTSCVLSITGKQTICFSLSLSTLKLITF